MILSRCATLLILALAAMSAGCATAPPRPDGTDWRLVAWSISSQRADGHGITARFADGSVSGRSGVNTYRGPAVFGAGNTLAIGPLATTRMAGPEPAMRAEGAYLALLADAKAYRLADGRLTLLDANGNERLVYEAAMP